MKRLTCSCLTIVLATACAALAVPRKTDAPPSRAVMISEAREALDAYVDTRFEPKKMPTKDLVAIIQRAGLSFAEVEKLLLEGRTRYADAPAKGESYRTLKRQTLDCDHVDYKFEYSVYLPNDYDAKKAYPLLLVGHGGNSSMSLSYARGASEAGLKPILADAIEHGYIVAAPLTQHGWGSIGNSILYTLISKMQRDYHVDPNRIYATGHSMGGHMAYRCALYRPDRWAAVAPMSGGYDYVKTGEVVNLFNIPGYVTYGKQTGDRRGEWYDINPSNEKIKEWMDGRGCDWVHQQKNGGHTIYEDEIPKVLNFLDKRSRNLYRDRVFVRMESGSVNECESGEVQTRNRKFTWNTDRLINSEHYYWMKLFPISKEKKEQRVWAVNKGNNHFEITTNNTRKLRLFFHDKMIDFDKPVRIDVNGKTLFDKKIERDWATMLELVRAFDDRGRIFQAAVDLTIDTDADVPEPTAK